MNRKFFNLLLMGALAVTAIGSVSSCKDYDDDINNLQDQINKVALQTSVDELKTQLANVQAAATTAQTTAEAALTKASAALTEDNLEALNEAVAELKTTAKENATNVAQAIQDAADAAAAAAAAQTSADDAAAAAEAAKTEAATKAQEAKDYADEKIAEKIAGLETTLSAVQNNEEVKAAIEKIAKAEVDAAIPADLSEKLDALTELINNAGTKEEIKELLASVKSFQGGIDALYTAVTGIEVLGSISHIEGFETQNTMSIICGKVARNYTFGEADACEDYTEENAHLYHANSTKAYVEDAVFSYSGSELLVRVNPTNVELKPEMIKFLDSKGNDLDEVIQVTNVEKYDELLTRGTGNATGLWKVSVKSLKDAEETKGTVTTTVEEDDKSILYAIAMNNTKAAEDRYVVSTYDVTFETDEYEAPTTLDEVMVSTDDDNFTMLDAVAPVEHEDCFPVYNGQKFQVSFAEEEVQDFEYFYVVLDKKHYADDDEIRAWESYNYEGLDEIIAVNHGTGKATLSVTIPEQYKARDEVQFRVFAISYDGKVVANKAFRVFVADNTIEDITGDLKVAGYNYMKTAKIALTKALDENVNSLPTEITVKSAGATEGTKLKVVFYETADATSSTTDVAKAKYVQFYSNSGIPTELKKLTDDAEATGVLEFEDESGLVVNTINVSLTKVMPTAADAVAKLTENGTISWKAAQLKDGVYTAYLYPTEASWTSYVGTGYKDLTQAINGLENFGKYGYVKIEEVKADEDGEYTEASTFGKAADPNSAWNVTIPAALIDGKTKHAATFGFNFGKISSESTDYVKVDATGDLYTFQIVFASPLDKSVQQYAFEKNDDGENVNILKYSNTDPVNVGSKNIAEYLKATNVYDDATFGGYFYVSDPTTSSLRAKLYLANNTQINGVAVNATAKLISNDTKTEDYFKVTIDADGKIEFTKLSETTVPTADVPSTLILSLYDCFGQEQVYELPFTVTQ